MAQLTMAPLYCSSACECTKHGTSAGHVVWSVLIGLGRQLDSSGRCHHSPRGTRHLLLLFMLLLFGHKSCGGVCLHRCSCMRMTIEQQHSNARLCSRLLTLRPDAKHPEPFAQQQPRLVEAYRGS